jgi:hypothetical protein
MSGCFVLSTFPAVFADALADFVAVELWAKTSGVLAIDPMSTMRIKNFFILILSR